MMLVSFEAHSEICSFCGRLGSSFSHGLLLLLYLEIGHGALYCMIGPFSLIRADGLSIFYFVGGCSPDLSSLFVAAPWIYPSQVMAMLKLVGGSILIIGQ